METLTAKILDYLKGQSFQVAVVFAVVLILTWLLRNRSAHIRYLLWLLVAIKCLTPPMMIFSVPVLPNDTPAVMELPMTVEVSPQTAAQESFAAPTPEKTRIIPMQLTEEPKMNPLKQFVSAPANILLCIWAAGGAFYLLWAAIKAIRLQLWLRQNHRPVGPQMAGEIEELSRLWNPNKAFTIRLLDNISQPFVWGLWRGTIYLPSRVQSIQTDRQKAVVMHEMAHVIRWDSLLNLMQILIQGLFWFHPLVWLANRFIRQEREKCCDEIAIARLNTQPKEYGSAIIETLVQEYHNAIPIPSLAVAGPIKNIEDRIKTIMQPGRRFFRRPSVIALLIIGILAVFVVPTTIALTQKITPPDYTLSGTVVDAQTEKPITGAIVFDDGYGPQPYQKGITDADGKFEYKSWNEEHNVAAKAEGYRQQMIVFKTTPFDNSKNLNFKLQPGQKTDAKIGTEENVKTESFIPSTSRIDETGRIVDKLDYPFVDDPDVIGTWQSVDFIKEPVEFQPGQNQGKSSELYLKELVVLPNGRMSRPWWTWTKGLIFHSGDKTASRYILKEMGGSQYIFFEWKSGDYVIRHQKPFWYVLKKTPLDTAQPTDSPAPLSPSTPNDPAAVEILKKTQSLYEGLTSYFSEGEVITDMDMSEVDVNAVYGLTEDVSKELQKTQEGQNILKKHPSFKNAFSIRLARPLYYIEWAQKVHENYTDTGAVWSDGQKHYQLVAGKKSLVKDREMALAAAVGVSGGASGNIPRLFYGNSTLTLENVKQEGRESIDGDQCYIITGTVANIPTKYWISQKTLLIRQSQERFGNIPRLSVELSEEELKKALESAGQPVTDEAIRQLKKTMESYQAAASKTKGSITETHRNIVINQPIDFEPYFSKYKDMEITPAANSQSTPGQKTEVEIKTQRSTGAGMTDPNQAQIAIEARFMFMDAVSMAQAGLKEDPAVGIFVTAPADSKAVMQLLEKKSLVLSNTPAVNTLDDSKAKFIQELFRQSKNVKQLTAPKTMAQNKEPCNLNIMQPVAYIDAQNNQKSIEKGFLLEVLPEITEDGKSVHLAFRLLMTNLIESKDGKPLPSVPLVNATEIQYASEIPDQQTLWLVGPEGIFEPSLSPDEKTVANRQRLLILIKPTIIKSEEQANPPQSSGMDSIFGGTVTQSN